MSRELLRRAFLVIPLGLATLAGCKDTHTTAPILGSNPLFAQGDGSIWTVNSLIDPGDGRCDDTDCTLREAISAAASGGQIVFQSALQGDILLANSSLVIDKALSINGGGRITVDAHGGSSVFIVEASTPISVTLDGLAMKNGFSFDGKGGAVRIDNLFGAAAVTIRNSTISGSNSPVDGGGIWVEQASSLTLLNSTVDANVGTGNGGAIYNDGTLTVIGSTISNNRARDGGGIYNTSVASTSLIQSTISGNNATLGGVTPGDGITSLGRLSLLSTTITKNDLAGLNSAGTTTVANSIIAGNACVKLQGTLTSLGYNLTDSPCLSQSPGPGDRTVAFAQVFTQVLEPTLQDNGGPTMTHALLARGLAVDAGYCPGETADQRGFTRPVDDPTMPNAVDACDMGAYEAQGPQVAVADLMVSQTVDKSSVKQGELLTYTVRVQNLGPQTAPNVVLNNVLSSGVTFFAARQNMGTITAPPRGETGTVTWNIGDMVDQANEFAEIQVTVLVRGKTTITNTATVSGNVADPNPANDSAAIMVTVAPGKSGKG